MMASADVSTMRDSFIVSALASARPSASLRSRANNTVLNRSRARMAITSSRNPIHCIGARTTVVVARGRSEYGRNRRAVAPHSTTKANTTTARNTLFR